MNGESSRADDEARLAARERRVRLAFVRGAEQQSRRAMGRPLTEDELRRIIARFPVGETSR